MKKVPKMISTKDLSYISDMFNWHLITEKKYQLYLEQIQDEECKDKINKLCEMHNKICCDLTKLLEGGTK